MIRPTKNLKRMLSKFPRIKKILLKIYFTIHKLQNLLIQNEYFDYVFLGDLFQKGSDGLSFQQYLIVSRIIDMENILIGGESSWDLMFRDLIDHDLDEEKKQDAQHQWKGIINSFKQYGYNPGLARIEVSTNKGEYCLPNNGSHRMAWCYCNNFLSVPVVKRDFPAWYPADGLSYMNSINVPNNKIMELDNKYEEIMNNLERPLLLYLNIDCKKIKEICSVLSRYGVIEDSDLSYSGKAVYDTKPNKYAKEHIKNFNKFEKVRLYNYKIRNLNLYYKKDKIYSRLIDTIKYELDRVSPAWGGICASVTETSLVRPYLEYELFKRLKHPT